ncbi:MAG: 4a-hydroxytetrahydrobiopterin dehydratase [Acidobacteriota bacterium]|jgi:4a-hydroxytetrahydrobiopterin dehydratase|nr:MAG: 4a-hydroxytetrahydrobiopterin dehydratase [Acidobacteriota bacterium]
MLLSQTDIEARLKQHPGWMLDGGAVAREFTFPSFPDAVAFVTRLGFDAEAADHHPDLVVSYRRVTVRWSTHSEGGVTEKDFAGVEQAERAAARFGGGA